MSKEIIPVIRIAQSIHLLRGQKVMIDFDLAGLYGVATKVLNQAVSRNRDRFPEDFMFRLTAEEVFNLRSRIVTSSSDVPKIEPVTSNWSQNVTGFEGHGGLRYRPYAFTEQGVAMLSSVLKSERAVKVNIAIMRAFVKLREMLDTNRELAKRFSELETRVGKHDDEIAAIIEAIRQLIRPENRPRREIGFHMRESSPRYGTRKRR